MHCDPYSQGDKYSSQAIMEDDASRGDINSNLKSNHVVIPCREKRNFFFFAHVYFAHVYFASVKFDVRSKGG